MVFRQGTNTPGCASTGKGLVPVYGEERKAGLECCLYKHSINPDIFAEWSFEPIRQGGVAFAEENVLHGTATLSMRQHHA